MGIKLYCYDLTNNFGDILGAEIVRRLTQKSIETCSKDYVGQKLLGLGSVLHFGRSKDIVWGAGLNSKVPEDMHKFETLDIRAVRGPITAEFLKCKNISVPNVFGDPGLLLSRFYTPKKSTKKEDVIIIPNYNDLRLFDADGAVDPRGSGLELVDRIANAKFVVGSALHAIVFAEAFGIPCRLVLPPNHSEAKSKYEDYYLGTDRDFPEVAESIEHAFRLGPVPKINNLKEIQNRLLAAFPNEFL